MTSLINPRILAQDTLRNVEAFDGSTISAQAGVPTPTSGYVVSLPGNEKVLQRFKGGIVSLNFVEHFIDTHRAELAEPGRYLGAWLDEGDLYLDVSEVHHELATAVRLGWERNQIAIYDIATEQSILTRPGRRNFATDAQVTADKLAHEGGWVRDWFQRLGTVHGDIMAGALDPRNADVIDFGAAAESPFKVVGEAIAELGDDGELHLSDNYGHSIRPV